MYDVVIVGAGCAGLIAAYELRHSNILIVEQAQRIGGRILTRAHDGTSYDLGAVFALDPQLLPMHCTLSALVRENRQVGLFHRGHLYRADDVLACLEQVGIAAADWEKVRDFAAGRSSELGAVAPDVLEIVQAFFHVIHPGEMQRYIPERQRDAFRTFDTEHYRHGNGEFLAYLETFFAHKLRLDTEVLSVAEQADHVDIALRTRGTTSTVEARAVIVATPAPAALRVIAAPGARCRAFLRSVQYAGGVVVAMGYAGARLPELAYVVTPGLDCNTLIMQTHPDTGRQVLLVYYVGKHARQLTACNDEQVAARTLSLVQRVFGESFVADALAFCTVHRWPLIGPVLTPHSYAGWDEARLRPSARVVLAGDYTHVAPTDPFPYGLSAAVASGIKAAGRAKAQLEPDGGSAAAWPGLIDVSVYAVKDDRPLFLQRKEEGNVAFYGLILQARYDARLHDYLLDCRQDSLWEYHGGFGVTAEDSMLVLEALSAVPRDAAIVARSVRRLVELFHCPVSGAFCTLSPHRDSVAACAKGRARYWEGPSIDATAQAGYLLHEIAPQTYAQELAGCADYLTRTQHVSGRWKGHWFPSAVLTTFYAMRFLCRMGPTYGPHVAQARQFLVAGQHPDGSWNRSVIDTAAAMLAFKAIGEPPPPGARTWLEAQRGPAGWQGEPVLYYWFELNARQKLFHHCVDKGQVTTAWATLALRPDTANGSNEAGQFAIA